MTNVYEPEYSSESVAAIVKVKDLANTPSDDSEPSVDVIFMDKEMISEHNLDVLVKTYIAVALLDKEKDAGAAFAITGVETKKAKLETIYRTVDVCFRPCPIFQADEPLRSPQGKTKILRVSR